MDPLTPQGASEEVRRARRRRINEAFRAGDLRECLRELTEALREEPEDEALRQAMEVVQTRYLHEVVEPAVAQKDWATVRAALAALKAAPLSSQVHEALQSVESSLPKEDLDVVDKTLHRAEEAWARGRRKEAMALLKALREIPLEDPHLIARRDGLLRLVAQEKGPGVRASSRLWWALLAVAAVVVAVVLRWFGPKPTPQPPPVAPPAAGWLVLATVPQSSLWDSAGTELGPSGLPLALTPGAQTITLRAPGYRDTTLTVEVVRGDTLRVEVTMAQEPPPRGTLRLLSDPEGAHVLEDTVLLGQTPLEVGLSPGVHRLLVSAEGRVSEWVEVEVRPGEVAETSVALARRYAFGRLQINAQPWAYVFVNGESLGPTPLTTKDLPTGVEHECLFRWPDGAAVRQKVRLDPRRGSPTPLMVVAPRATLAISVTDPQQRPLWATVWVGQTQVGQAPGEFQVPSGPITVRVERPGFEPQVHTVNLDPGGKATLQVTLRPSQ